MQISQFSLNGDIQTRALALLDAHTKKMKDKDRDQKAAGSFMKELREIPQEDVLRLQLMKK